MSTRLRNGPIYICCIMIICYCSITELFRAFLMDKSTINHNFQKVFDPQFVFTNCCGSHNQIKSALPYFENKSLCIFEMKSEKLYVCKYFKPNEQSLLTEDFDKVLIETVKGKIPILVHSREDTVSNQIIQTNDYEILLSDEIIAALSTDKDLHFIDIGCNIGPFTLKTAALGRNVIAVDANLENLKYLLQSVQINNFNSQVVIVNNAISDKRGEDTIMVVPARNIGAGVPISKEKLREALECSQNWTGQNSFLQKICEAPEKTNEFIKDFQFQANFGFGKMPMQIGPTQRSIRLDDLISIMPFKKYVIKMDIEGNEHKALRSGQILFDSFDIKFVFMEWKKMYDQNFSQVIRNFFSKRGYTMHVSINSTRQVSPNEIPWDVVWIKRS